MQPLTRARWAPRLLVALLYAVGFAIIGSALLQHFGFPLDDSWIHQSVGRNFAEFGSLGYLPEQRSSGSTSLLWTLILSVNYRLAPGVSPVLFTLFLNVLFAVATAELLLSMALRDGQTLPVAILIAVAPAADGNYMWLAFTGMEHLLFITASVAAISLWMTPATAGRNNWPNTIGAGVCMGLLGMTRPEGVVLPVLLLAAAAVSARLRTRSTVQVAAAGAIFAVLASLPPLVNLYTSQSLLPVTFKGRSWMLVSDAANRLAAMSRLPEQAGTRVFKSVVAFSIDELNNAERIALAAGLLVIVVLSIVGIRALIQQRAWRLLTVCAWGTLHAALYLFILPATGHGGRYQPFLLLLLLPLLTTGAVALLRGQGRPQLAIPTVGLLLIGGFSLTLWRGVLVSGIDHITHTHGVIAQWLSEHLPDQTVAVFDIGRIGYDRGKVGDPRIVDLGGLTDPAYLSYLYGGRVPSYLAQHGVRYLVLPGDASGRSGLGERLRLTDNPQVERQRLFRICSSPQDWRLGVVQTGNAMLCQEVDSVRFVQQ
jgi:hypothetical protein